MMTLNPSGWKPKVMVGSTSFTETHWWLDNNNNRNSSIKEKGSPRAAAFQTCHHHLYRWTRSSIPPLFFFFFSSDLPNDAPFSRIEQPTPIPRSPVTSGSTSGVVCTCLRWAQALLDSECWVMEGANINVHVHREERTGTGYTPQFTHTRYLRTCLQRMEFGSDPTQFCSERGRTAQASFLSLLWLYSFYANRLLFLRSPPSIL